MACLIRFVLFHFSMFSFLNPISVTPRHKLIILLTFCFWVELGLSLHLVSPCGGWIINAPDPNLQSLPFECLFLNWWPCVQRFRSCNMSLGMGFESFKTWVFWVCSLFPSSCLWFETWPFSCSCHQSLELAVRLHNDD